MIGLLPLSTFFRAQGQGESKYLHGLRGDSFHWDGPSLGCKSQSVPFTAVPRRRFPRATRTYCLPALYKVRLSFPRTRLNLHTNNSAPIKHYCEL
jgi:hypothetical protein